VDPRIADYALLSDCQGSALVSRAGSVDWCCLPRFDAPSVFARLLGRDAGHWVVAPDAEFTTERSYLDQTMVLRTVFRTATGAVAVTDALCFAIGEREHHIGRAAPHVLVRHVEGVTGHVAMATSLAPRPGYGLTVPLAAADGTGARTRGGPRACTVSSTVGLDIDAGHITGRFIVEAGATELFALQLTSPWAPAPHLLTGDDMKALLASTIEGWRSWSALHQRYDGSYRDLVHHSGRVLQALTYAPTGAVVAAPTASLPEAIGGERNWDYRYCWVRDASLTLGALWVAACPDEAADFVNFFVTAAGGVTDAGAALQILYGVEGERYIPEHTLGHLEGFRNSAPVRVGNAAWSQRQLDVYGELLDAACLLAEQLGELDDAMASFLRGLADAAARRWQEPDQGIWEVRGGPRHFLYSKLLCWVALDRAVRLGSALASQAAVSAWAAERDRIRGAILEHGWSDTAGAFTQSFGSDVLDASALMVPILGFLPPGDERVRATVEAVAERLTDGRGFVFRYLADDGLPGGEGTFTICTFWLAHCFALLGDVDRARSLFDRVVSHANDVGLLSEEIDPVSGELLGNFPQAFTHIGLVNAAWAIDQAARATSLT